MTAAFRTTVQAAPGSKATGIPIPDEIIESLGSSRKPPVIVRIGGFSYRTTVSSRWGGFIVPLSAERREAAGLSAGDEIEVSLELDPETRIVEIPVDLATALEVSGTRAAFDALSPSRQKAQVALVGDAKTAGTRERRIAAVISELRDA
jgi:hypothetical protein